MRDPEKVKKLSCSLYILFQIKRELRGIHKYGGRCYVRLKDKTGGSKSLVQTSWSGGRGDLRRVKKDTGNGARK